MEHAALEAIKINVKMEELKGYLREQIDCTGEQIASFSEAGCYSKASVAVNAMRRAELIRKCYDIIDIIDTIRDYTDKPVEELYKQLFRNVTVK